MYSLHGSELSQRIEHVGRRTEVHGQVPEPEVHEQVPEQVSEPEVYVYFVPEQVSEPGVHEQRPEPESLTEVSMNLRKLTMTDWSVSKYVNLFGYPDKARGAPFGDQVWFGMRKLLDEAYQSPVRDSPGWHCTRQELRVGWFWAPVPFSADRAWTTTPREDHDPGQRPRPVYPCYIHMYSETVVCVWCLHIKAKGSEEWLAHIDRISFCDNTHNGW